jgi:hypothetical protein
VEAAAGKSPAGVEAAYVVHHTNWIRTEFIRRTGGLWGDMASFTGAIPRRWPISPEFGNTTHFTGKLCRTV